MFFCLCASMGPVWQYRMALDFKYNDRWYLCPLKSQWSPLCANSEIALSCSTHRFCCLNLYSSITQGLSKRLWKYAYHSEHYCWCKFFLSTDKVKGRWQISISFCFNDSDILYATQRKTTRSVSMRYITSNSSKFVFSHIITVYASHNCTILFKKSVFCENCRPITS